MPDITPKELAARCEAVGWVVRMSKSGHYRVWTAGGTGTSFTVPATPGDTRSMKNSLGQARRLGLERLEAEQANGREKQRKARIAKDRGRVGEALLAAVARRKEDDNDKDKEDGDKVASKEVAAQKGALGYVDGLAIVERAQAYVRSPAPAMKGQKVQLHDASELLLEDGSVVYRCEKYGSWKGDIPDDQPCHATFDSSESVRIHITFHTRKIMPVGPGVRKKMNEDPKYAKAVRARQDARRERAPASPQPQPNTSTKDESEEGIVARLKRVTERVNSLWDAINELNNTAEEVSAELTTLAQELPDHLADEDTIDKARRFDSLRKAFE